MFVSYAQNYEDVILWRLFKDIESGFYVDVGAMDPVEDSVTKAFYDRGWKGINIEPVDYYYTKIKNVRPDDINIKTAVSNIATTKSFFEIRNTGLSTLNSSVANCHVKKGMQVEEREVRTETLNSILASNAPDTIHFLKIDVEGHEKEVIEGLDLEIWRPWVILIESTKPNTQIPNQLEWESLILKNHYHFVYFDGLNRFYVADNHSELDGGFDSPPNFFDNFISVHHQSAVDQLKEKQEFILNLERQNQYLHKELAIVEEQLSDSHIRIAELQTELNEENKKKDQALKNLQQELTEKYEEITPLRGDSDHQNAMGLVTTKKLKAQLEEASKKADKYYLEYVNLLQSRSWRFTKPIRVIAGILRHFWSKLTTREITKPTISLYYWAKRSRKFKTIIDKIRSRYPKLWNRVRDKIFPKSWSGLAGNYLMRKNNVSPIKEDQQYFITLFNHLSQMENREEK